MIIKTTEEPEGEEKNPLGAVILSKLPSAAEISALRLYMRFFLFRPQLMRADILE